MNAIFRVVTRIQDQDDFSGNLTDGEFLRYNSSTDKFELQSVSPGGDSGQIQYNNNGTFAGVDHSSIGISGDIFKLSSLAVSDIPFVVKGFSGQTANLTEWRNNSDAILARFDSSGNLFTGAITASGGITAASSLSLGATGQTANTPTILLSHDIWQTRIISFYNTVQYATGGDVHAFYAGGSGPGNAPFRAAIHSTGVSTAAAFIFGATSTAALGDVRLVRNSSTSVGVKASDGTTDAALTCGIVTVGGSATLQHNSGWLQTNVGVAVNGFGSSSLGVGGLNGFPSGIAAGSIQIESSSAIGFSDTVWFETKSAISDRPSTGIWRIRANNGLQVKNLAGSAAAPITCGAITASGNITLAAGATITSGYGQGLTIGDSSNPLTLNVFDLLIGPFVRVHNNLASMRLGATIPLEWESSGSPLSYTAATSCIIPNVSGQIDVRGNSGLRVRNYANSADAALTCGAITASGAVKTDNLYATNWLKLSGTNQTTQGIAVRNGGLSLGNNVAIGWSTTTDPTANQSLYSITPSSGLLTFSGAITASGTVATGNILKVGGVARFLNLIGTDGCLVFSAESSGTATLKFGFRDATSTGSLMKFTNGSSTFAFRNGDDSADAAITTGAITASGAITATSNMVLDPSGLATLRSVQVGFIATTAGAARGVLNGASTATYFGSSVTQNVIIGANSRADLTIDGTTGAITTTGDITLAASQRLFVSNGAATGNYLLSGATAVFANNSVAQGGWNTAGMYARRLFIDYANADICLARASTSNLGVYAGDGTTPAALTCGAITASGNITLPSSGSVGANFASYYTFSGTWGFSNANGAPAIQANSVNIAQGRPNQWMLAQDVGIVWHPTETNLSGSTTQDVGIYRASAGVLQVGTTTANASGSLLLTKLTATSNVTTSGQFIANASGLNMILLNSAGTVYGSIGNDAGDKWSLGYKATTATTLGTPVLTWTSAGFVGINKVSPTVALDVNGAITASGQLSVNNIQPYSGNQLVFATGTGYNLYWSNSGLYSLNYAQPLGTSSHPWGTLTCGRISTRQSGTGINIETDGLISGDAWASNDYGFVRIQNYVDIGRGLFSRLNAGGYNNGIIVQGINSTSIGIQFASASPHQGSPLAYLLYTVGSGFSLLGSDAATSMALTCGAITASGGLKLSGASPTLTANSIAFISSAGLETYNAGSRSGYYNWDATTVRSDAFIGFASSTSVPQGAGDTCFRRNSAGVIEINNGTAGQYRDLMCRIITASGAITCGAITASDYIYGTSAQFSALGAFGGYGVGSATLAVQALNSSTIGMNIRGQSGQTADLLKCKTSANTDVFTVGPTGAITSSGSTITLGTNAWKLKDNGASSFVVETSGGTGVAMFPASTGGEVLFQGGYLRLRGGSGPYLDFTSGTGISAKTNAGADLTLSCGAITASGAVTAVADDFYVSDSGTYYFSNVSRNRGMLISSGSGGRIGFKAGGTEWLQISDAGAIAASGAITASSAGLSCEVDPVNWRFRLSTTGTSRMDLDQYSLRLVDSASILWSSTGNNVNTTKLLGLCKNDTTNYLQINNGTEGTLNGLECGAITASGTVTISATTQLALTNSAGVQRATINDYGSSIRFQASSSGYPIHLQGNNHGIRVGDGTYTVDIKPVASNSVIGFYTGQGTTAASGALAGIACGAITAGGTVKSSGAWAAGVNDAQFGKGTWNGDAFIGNSFYFENGTGFSVGSGTLIGWSSSAYQNGASTTYDTRLTRNAAGIVQIGTTANNASGSLLLTNLTASGNINIGPMTLSTGRQGMAIYSQGMFAINGDAQKVLWVLCRKTTDATPTTLMADGSSTRLTIPSGKTMSCKVTVKGIKSDGSAKARFVRLVEITNVGGTTALDMSPEALGTDYNPSGCACDITADDTNDALNISVTGIVAETWRWVAIVEGLEIAYGT